MALTCPRCGLLSPPEALRCDCGYDFATKTVSASYLTAHLIDKQGGDEKALATAANWYIKSSAALLILAGGMALINLLMEGRIAILGWPLAIGLILLLRGQRLRRRHKQLLAGRPLSEAERHALGEKLS